MKKAVTCTALLLLLLTACDHISVKENGTQEKAMEARDTSEIPNSEGDVWHIYSYENSTSCYHVAHINGTANDICMVPS